MKFLHILVIDFFCLVGLGDFFVVDNSEVKRVTRFALVFTSLFSTLEMQNSILLAQLFSHNIFH